MCQHEQEHDHQWEGQLQFIRPTVVNMDTTVTKGRFQVIVLPLKRGASWTGDRQVHRCLRRETSPLRHRLPVRPASSSRRLGNFSCHLIVLPSASARHRPIGSSLTVKKSVVNNPTSIWTIAHRGMPLLFFERCGHKIGDQVVFEPGTLGSGPKTPHDRYATRPHQGYKTDGARIQARGVVRAHFPIVCPMPVRYQRAHSVITRVRNQGLGAMRAHNPIVIDIPVRYQCAHSVITRARNQGLGAMRAHNPISRHVTRVSGPCELTVNPIGGDIPVRYQRAYFVITRARNQGLGAMRAHNPIGGDIPVRYKCADSSTRQSHLRRPSGGSDYTVGLRARSALRHMQNRRQGVAPFLPPGDIGASRRSTSPARRRAMSLVLKWGSGRSRRGDKRKDVARRSCGAGGSRRIEKLARHGERPRSFVGPKSYTLVTTKPALSLTLLFQGRHRDCDYYYTGAQLADHLFPKAVLGRDDEKECVEPTSVLGKASGWDRHFSRPNFASVPIIKESPPP
ncbi:hypothetical protein Bbelb_080590 [Branchiostoma belcheri]|nr:hypothetical protein Bbelb_080590 [Branchiostoma belcheri]